MKHSSKNLARFIAILLVLVSGQSLYAVTTNFAAVIAENAPTYYRPRLEAPVDYSSTNTIPVLFWTKQSSRLKRYTVQALVPAVTGQYTITYDWNEPEWLDTVAFLYQSSFDPSRPTLFGWVGNDDPVQGVLAARLSNVPLTAGVTYLLVSSEYSGEACTISYQISGPGAVTALGLPGVPTNVVATAGAASASVGFTAPTGASAAGITGYLVTSSPGGFTATGAGSPLLVSNLTNGTSYTFTVRANNATGTAGAASAASAAVVPASVPSQPAQVMAMPGPGQAIVGFLPPAEDGGVAITLYTVTATPADGGPVVTATGSASPITVTGLTNGVTYSITVKATNSVGTGPESVHYYDVRPYGPPGAPTGVSAAAGYEVATVAFTAPANTGGLSGLRYTVTSNPAGGWDCNAGTSALSHTIMNLTNGVSYTFTVTAENGHGAGPASSASAAVTPARNPAPPTGTAATAGDGQATVTFTVPASNGGATITGYTVTSVPAGGTDSNAGSTALSHVITGLTNGTRYTFTVKAANSVGSSYASNPSAAVTPVGLPGAPTSVTATASNTAATVSFSAPATNGGAAITSYTVTSTPGGLTATGSAAPITVTGLTNGTSYTFTVKATNSVGTGAASSASAAVTPAPTAPAAPTDVAVAGGNAQATVTFTAPANTGGSAITGYTVTATPAGGGSAVTATGAGSPITVTGLTNGTSYTFTVKATNSTGPGAASAASAAVTPATLPGAPTSAAATAGNGQATVTFTAPANTGGGTITSYTVTSSPGGITATGSVSPITITGLTNLTWYYFTVKATNSTGTGPASSVSSWILPVPAVPGAPTSVLAAGGDGTATVSFAAPEDTGGGAITGYTVTSSPAGGVDLNAGTAYRSHVISGLANGTSYTFTVKATNYTGMGPASSASNPVTPAAPAAMNATLAHRWTFDSDLHDSVGTWHGAAGANDSYTTGTPAISNAGSQVGAGHLALDGNGYVTLGTQTLPADFTITGWIYVQSPVAPQYIQTLITNGPDWLVGGGFKVFVNTWAPAGGPDGAILAEAGNGTSGLAVTTAPGYVSVDTWKFVAVVISRSTSTATFYEGGVPIYSGAMRNDFNLTGTINIGAFNNPPYASFKLKGRIDDLCLYDGLLTPAQIRTQAGLPTTAPAAPRNVAVAGGNTQATVTFAAPFNDGGATITGYTVTSSPAGGTDTNASSTGLSHVITGLTNGTSYTFTVTATNSVGPGAASSASAAVTPANLPDAPTGVAGSGGNGQATVTFTAPGNNGGATITGYIATSSPGGLTATGASSPLTVTGLTNGTSYTFTVTATNSTGTGAASAASAAVTPANAPGVPTSVTAVGGNGQATVTFAAPANTGGAVITGYTVTTVPAGGTDSDAGSTGLSHVITGLTNGTSYTFTVKATNSMGTSSASGASAAVTPTNLPGAPTGVTGAGGNGQATVTFTAPVSAGGSAITGYTVTSSPAGGTDTNAGSTGLSHVITGLTNGTSYTFTVTATNSAGTGEASSASAAVTSANLPGAPTGILAEGGDAQATVTFLAPFANGGAAITGYSVTSSPVGGTDSDTGSTGLSHGITGLTNGTSYTFTVTATNSTGTGAASSASAAVIPVAVPGVPTGVAVAGSSGRATVSFTAPASTGGLAITSYTVTATPAGGGAAITATGASSPVTVNGLTNDTSYAITVTATNSAGTGAASSPAAAVTPTGVTLAAGAPGVPRGIAATAGSGQATVTFAAPSDNGGAAITGYTVTSIPAGGTDTSAGSTGLSHVITGLTNGTSYTFTVKASNSAGTGTASTPSDAVVPVTAPGAPTGVAALAGEAMATVTFTAPASDGGTAIMGYTVTSSPAGGTDLDAGSADLSHDVTGLTDGTSYTFTVKATNSAGAGPASAASAAVTPGSRPEAPTSVTAVAANTAAAAVVSFTAPADTGGLALTGYVVTAVPVGVGPAPTATASTGPVTVTGLSPSGSYRFLVSAINAFGVGKASVLSAVLTLDTTAPVITSATTASATYNSAFTYTVTASGGATSYGATGLPPGLSIASGTGAITGTPTASGSFTVSLTAADAAGNVGTAMLTLTVAKLAQTISFDPPADRLNNAGSFSLTATASSGLAVSYAIVSGPAMLSGSAVAPTGVPGTVVIRAAQAGDAIYAAAPDVTVSFTVTAAMSNVYFGAVRSTGSDTRSGDVGGVLPPNSNHGSLLVVAPTVGVNLAVGFTLSPDGTFELTYVPPSGTGTSTEPRALDLAGPPRKAATAVTLTIRGSLINGVLQGVIEPLGLTFSAPVLPVDGPSAGAAGYYQSSSLATATGTTYSVIGTNNQVLVLAVTPAVTTGGLTTLAADGSFSLQTQTGAGTATIRGSVDVTTTIVNGTISLPSAAPTSFAGIASTTTRTDRLINLSTRGQVGGGRTLITGFVVGGATPKRVLLRAVGPTLANFGVGQALVNPQLKLFDATGQVIAQNDDWSGADTSAAVTQVGAFSLATGTKDAALLATLAPGVYTMHVADHGGTGVALAEIYDASSNPNADYQRLINMSSRGEVGGGEDMLICGFIITGNSPKRVLVRAVGPGLTPFGVTGALADPRLRVFAGSTLIGENDNWSAVPADAATTAQAAVATGAFALTTGSKDAAFVITLQPGAYTGQVSSADGTSTGTALVEIYELP